MKLLSAFPLFLLATLAGPALAETTTDGTLAEACPLAGPLNDATKECHALRVFFRSEIDACMAQLRTEAMARAGQVTVTTSYGYRARFITCDAATRGRLGLALN